MFHKPLIPLNTPQELSIYFKGYNSGMDGNLMPYKSGMNKDGRLILEVGFEQARDHKNKMNTIDKRWPNLTRQDYLVG